MTKKVKYLTVVLFIALTFVTGLTGCGKKTDANSSVGESSTPSEADALNAAKATPSNVQFTTARAISVVPNRNVQYDDGKMYLWGEGILQTLSQNAGQADGRILYTCAEDEHLIGFTVSQSKVYALLSSGELDSKLIFTDSDGESTEIAHFTGTPYNQLTVYRGILYLAGYTDESTVDGWSLSDTGVPTQDLGEKAGIYADFTYPENSKDVQSRFIGSGRYTLPYCFEQFGRGFYLDENGNLVSVDIDDPLKTAVIYQNSEDKSDENKLDFAVVALTSKYLVTVKLNYTDINVSDKVYSVVNLSDGSIKELGKVNGQVIECDESGLYFFYAPVTTDGETAFRFTKLNFDTGTEQELFDDEKEASVSIDYDYFALNTFGLTEKGIWYVRTSDYDDYWFTRNHDDYATETRMGLAVYSSEFDKAGISIEESAQTIYADDDTPVLLVTTQIPVFSGETDAVAAMNEFFADRSDTLVSDASATAIADQKSWVTTGQKAVNNPPGSDSAADSSTEEIQYVEGDEVYTGLPYTHDEYCLGLTATPGRYLSLKIRDSDFRGGSHGDYTENYFIFDSETGSRLALTDIIGIDEDTFRQMMLTQLKIQIDAYPDMFFENAMEEAGSIDINSLGIYLTNEGLGVGFPLYSIAPYASGTKNIVIDYSGLDMKIEI